jgi:SAM-dependent methyltransferase
LSVSGRRILELGPGRTCELLAAFILAGGESGLGLDTTAGVAENWPSPERLEQVWRMLDASGMDFLGAVGASPESAQARYGDLVATEIPLQFSRYDGRTIPLRDHSIGLIISKSVLEHVPQDQVEPLVSEMRRVLKSDGMMLHIIDLRDHMHIDNDVAVGDWLDALTYPDWLFKAMFSHRPVLINRFRAHDWEGLFEDHGFRILVEKKYRLPLPEHFSHDRLEKRWRSLDAQILSVAQIAFVLTV